MYTTRWITSQLTHMHDVDNRIRVRSLHAQQAPMRQDLARGRKVSSKMTCMCRGAIMQTVCTHELDVSSQAR